MGKALKRSSKNLESPAATSTTSSTVGSGLDEMMALTTELSRVFSTEATYKGTAQQIADCVATLMGSGVKSEDAVFIAASIVLEPRHAAIEQWSKDRDNWRKQNSPKEKGRFKRLKMEDFEDDD